MVRLPEPETPMTTTTDGSSSGMAGCIGVLQPSGTVDKPHQIALCARPRGRKVLTGTNTHEDVVLVSAGDEEQHLPGRCQCGEGECDARDERSESRSLDTDDPAFCLVERRTVRKQRSRMSVAGKPHQNEIEQRMRRIESIAPIEALELRLVVACRHVWAICIRGDWVNVAGRNAHAIEEEPSRHAHIAVGVVPWHEAVVAHEPVHPTPGQFAAILLAH